MRYTWYQLDRLEKLIKEGIDYTTVYGILHKIITEKRARLVEAIGEENVPVDLTDWRRYDPLKSRTKRILERLVKEGYAEKSTSHQVNAFNSMNRYKRIVTYYVKEKKTVD